MNVVDSSAWLEFFADGPNAQYFFAPIDDAAKLIVPSITVLEVFKRVLQQRNKDSALEAVAVMRRGSIIELDLDLALDAAGLGVEHKLPLADSVVLATAKRHKAILWTQDADFEGLPDVNYRPRKS